MNRPVALGLLALLVGCSDPGEPQPDAGDGDGGIDAEVVDAGPREPDVCDELGLPRAAFRTTDAAPDFAVTTTRGAFRLSEAWTGCESYVFFTHLPGVNDALFRTGPDGLFLDAPPNVHFFFLSDAPDEAARRAVLEPLEQQVDEGLAFAAEDDPSLPSRWRDRFHFVLDRATEIEGGPGAYLRDELAWAATPEAIVDLGERGRARPPAPSVFGIDRAQQFDPGDSLAPVVGRADQLRMGAFLPHFYDYRYALEERLRSEEATVVPLVDERTTERVLTRAARLPEGASIDAFDTLEVDLVVDCEERNPFGCSEWDRIANVFLCADGEACTERLEIARWITPYWRRGRQHYLLDASPFLGLLGRGGEHHVRVELGPEWERPTPWRVQASLRLRRAGAPLRASGGVLAFTGGAFDETYNAREPFRFTPPSDATRVELVTLVSGHGQTSGDNCAEWCAHEHVFTLDGVALPPIAHEGARIGAERGCAERARDGVIPGQLGNWAIQRAYWCPGLPVEAQRQDITARIRPGEPSVLEYAGRFAGGEPRGGDIALSAYVVWYGAR